MEQMSERALQDGVQQRKEIWSGKATRCGSFQSTNTDTSVCTKEQHNAGGSSGNQPDSLTFAKWELIHFVNVLFCTASCSSVNQSPERHYQSHAIINKERFKTQSSHCPLFWELIAGLQSWMTTLTNFDIITFRLMCLNTVAVVVREGIWHLEMAFSLAGLLFVWTENPALKIAL